MSAGLEAGERSLVVVTAGLSQPSSTRLLSDRLAAATERHLDDARIPHRTTTIELRDHAQDLVHHLLTGFPSPTLQAALDAVTSADGVIAVTPIFNASYSGLFKVFFDVLERGSLARVPVLLGATGGTARHSLAIEHAMRPLFAYLNAATVPTGVYASAEDWGAPGVTADRGLAGRIDRAGAELADAIRLRAPHGPAVDRLDDPIPFEDLLRSPGRTDRG
jgi:FMN reductase